MRADGGDEGQPNGRAPWYAQLGLHVLTHVAPWTLLSLVLVSLVTGWLPFPVLSAFIQLRGDVSRLAALTHAHDQLLMRFVQAHERSLDIQRATCWNTARTIEDQRRCYRPLLETRGNAPE